MSTHAADKNSSSGSMISIGNITTGYEVLVSTRTREIVELVLLVILTGLVSMFGIVTNIINIVIFYKQGLTTTINISFFALAVSDVICVATMEWVTICFNPLFDISVPQWDTRLVAYLTATWLHLCFGRITCWTTTYITAERCLCIAMPLKVKQIVTPRRATFIISFLYCINLVTLIPFYMSTYLDWVFIPERNVTLLTMAARDNKSLLEPVAYVLNAFLGTASFPLVILFTTILVYKLRRQRTWRMKSSSDQNQKATASTREVKTMNMVVLIAAILIACYTPGILASLITFFVPSFNLVGDEMNLFISVWSFAVLVQVINSSVNIFLYYKMSTKYKQTFNELFSFCTGAVTDLESFTKQSCYKDE